MCEFSWPPPRGDMYGVIIIDEAQQSYALAGYDGVLACVAGRTSVLIPTAEIREALSGPALIFPQYVDGVRVDIPTHVLRELLKHPMVTPHTTTGEAK